MTLCEVFTNFPMSVEGCEMYFLWKEQNNGNLAISRSGLREFVDELLPDGYRCEEINLLPESDEIVVVVSLPELHSTVEKELVKDKVTAALKNMGFKNRYTWASEKSCRWLPFKKISFVSPFFWGGLVALLVALLNLGFGGLFLVVISGVAGFIASCAVNYLNGKGDIKRALKSIWR